MRTNGRMFLAAAMVIAFDVWLFGPTALAADDVVEEIVVYGTRVDALPVLDMTSFHVDLKQHARSLGRSVHDALDEKRSETQIAATADRPRG